MSYYILVISRILVLGTLCILLAACSHKPVGFLPRSEKIENCAERFIKFDLTSDAAMNICLKAHPERN